ncbi:hypothetical protein CHS0354_027712, partial [Potamilus streckersoni]
TGRSLLTVFCSFILNPDVIFILLAKTDSETVWLKDVTTLLQTDKRTLSDDDLPDQLSFILKSKSHTLTLNLKRNYDIDPNADIYTVRKLNDGRSLLEKTDNIENEDVAYYQDRDNGAFMTVRCIKGSNSHCERLITEADFPHNVSRMHMVNGEKMIDVIPYITDLVTLELTNPFVHHPEYD